MIPEKTRAREPILSPWREEAKIIMQARSKGELASRRRGETLLSLANIAEQGGKRPIGSRKKILHYLNGKKSRQNLVDQCRESGR